MKKAFTVLAALLLLAVVTQFYLAATGAFDSAPNEQAFELHRLLGNAVIAFSALVAIAAAIARVPGRVIGQAGLVAALVVLQSLIREVAEALGEGAAAGHFVFGVHALNGLAILGLTSLVVRQARQLAWPPAVAKHPVP
ncbi:DUF6220 domain-containing protein [Actinosynnema sp. NPDC050436]|uniref:DUF6220 domain-containing protein n=1 Tax=Actinosynnema sp. NPDC050436 TaxID=3155659 RepID=UPI0033CA1742